MGEKTIGCCVLEALRLALSKAKKIRVTIEVVVEDEDEHGGDREDSE